MYTKNTTYEAIRFFSGSTIVYHQRFFLSILVAMLGLLAVVFINYVSNIAMLSIA